MKALIFELLKISVTIVMVMLAVSLDGGYTVRAAELDPAAEPEIMYPALEQTQEFDDFMMFSSTSSDMTEYWLEQIFYQYNGFNMSLQQILFQLNGVHLNFQTQLKESREHYQKAIEQYAKTNEVNESISTVFMWQMVLLAFQTALTVVLIFAVVWGRR
jgi:hypothetical protein